MRPEGDATQKWLEYLLSDARFIGVTLHDRVRIVCIHFLDVVLHDRPRSALRCQATHLCSHLFIDVHFLRVMLRDCVMAFLKRSRTCNAAAAAHLQCRRRRAPRLALSVQ